MGSKSIVILFLALCVGAQTPQAPERALKGLSLEQLGNVEVTTMSKAPVKASRAPAAVYVITREDIRRSGAASLPEALRLAPGVEVARIDSVKWAIGMRGFESRLSRAVLVLIDGRTVYSPLFHGVYWEVQDTLLEDIERIEVIRGPGGTIWGANAVNGVINVITRHARDTRGVMASLGGGDVNQGLGSVRYGGGSDKFNYRVYAQGTTRGPGFHFDGQNFDDWRRTQGGFRVDWDTSARDTVTVQGDLYAGLAGESTRITSESPPSSTVVDENAVLSGGNVLTRWRRDLGNGSDFQVQAYYDRVNRRQANQAEYRDTFDVDFVHHLSLRWGQDFIWGAGGRVSLGRVPDVVSTFVFNPPRRTDQLYSVFVQDEIPLVGEKLRLTAGVKVLHSSFSGFDAEPGVRLLWAASPRQTLWSAVTRAVRTPSDVEDTLTTLTLKPGTASSFNRVSGDGAFTSEIMTGLEAGYRNLVNARVSIDVAGFYNRYDHLLSLEAGTPFLESSPASPNIIYPFENRNGLRGHTKGFEIVPTWKPASWWKLGGSYAYLRMSIGNRPGSNDLTTPASLVGSSPNHQVSLQSYIDLPKRVEFSQMLRYVSALPAQGVTGYATVDARLAWRPAPHVEISIVGQNLLQPHHPEFGGDPTGLVDIRRNVFAAVTWRQ